MMSSAAKEDPQPQPNNEYKLLQDHKKILLSRLYEMSKLSSIELVELSEELRNSLVITPEVDDLFAALDHARLDSKLRIRYLLQQVCERVGRDGAVLHEFLDVLAGYGGHVEELAKCLREEWRAGTEESGGSQAVAGDRLLLKGDVKYLMKILASASYKWEELGMALDLPKAAREDCRISTSNILKLENILLKWVTGEYGIASLEHLKQALASELVGVADVANSLEKKFCEAKIPVPTIVAERKPGLATGLTIVNQSKNTVVADGKSTLMEVLVSDNEGVRYHWMKDGQSLTDGLAYAGTKTAMLAIILARQGTQGDYTCHVTRGREEVTSKAIPLTVDFPPEKKQLIVSYTKCAEVPEDSWPPKVTNTFIDLALIMKRKELTDDLQYSVRGDIDDILESKEKTEFAAVFGEYECGALVLVEGRPGSGKTTLVHKVSRDWATGGKVLTGAKLVFLIPLRSLANRKTEELSDILELFYHDRQEREMVVGDIRQSKGEGVCFLLDGLDEFQTRDKSKSVIHQLLYEKYLPMAMVVVASRPVATGNLRDKPHVTKRIEVLGFSRAQILEYIYKYPFASDASNSASLSSQLKSYLNSHQNLLHMCYLPVHAAMICFLHKHERGNIPHTQTKIYQQFTRFVVLRKQRRRNEDAYLDSLDDLHGEDEQYFSKICHLAWEMTTLCKQTVHQRDTKVPLSLGNGPDDAPSLGLVTIERTACLGGSGNTYSFLHLTFQEYLAACYLAKLKEDVQIEMIRLYAGEEHMLMVWKFYCGLMKFEDKVDQIQHIIRSAGKWRDADLYAAQCAFESQQPAVYDKWREALVVLYTLTVPSHYLT